MTDRRVFPFNAVVGHDDAKLALRLAALDPLIGGVLLRGEKGSAKTTLARGLAAELGGGPFVELPLGASEDRVVGTLDTRAALTGGEMRFQPGLLAAAHGGVLYVDEINLLADHLVDILLDVAVSGENIVERDGFSHRHPARFVLIGSMNPEEGELRPQLLDRFGLCVQVTASRDLDERTEAVRRRLRFDRGDRVGPTSAEVAWDAEASPDAAAVPDLILDAASRLALSVGAEGLRADMTLCRAAAALAAGERREVPDIDDLRRIAPLVLAHRSRRNPFDPPVAEPDTLDEAIDDALGEPDPSEAPDEPTENNDDGVDIERPLVIGSLRRPPQPSTTRRETAARGRERGSVEATAGDSVAVIPTIKAVAARRANGDQSPVQPDDLRSVVRERRRHRTIVLTVDLSGSMGAPERAEAASGTVLGLLTTAYEKRDSVALVTFAGDDAEVVVAPTTSVEVARNRLDGLVTGGATPLAAGLHRGCDLARRAGGDDRDGVLVVLTDGRATGAGGMDAALDAAAMIARSEIDVLVLDCETGQHRLGLARDLAEAMGARYVHVGDLTPEHLTHTIRSHVRAT